MDKEIFFLLKKKIIELEDVLYDRSNPAIYRSILVLIEKLLIEHMLERTYGNRFKAARLLGINRNTINSKIKILGINPAVYKIKYLNR